MICFDKRVDSAYVHVVFKVYIFWEESMLSYEDMLTKLRGDRNLKIKKVCEENNTHTANFYRYLRVNKISSKNFQPIPPTLKEVNAMKEDKTTLAVKVAAAVKMVEEKEKVKAGYAKFLKIKKLVKKGSTLLNALKVHSTSSTSYYYYKKKELANKKAQILTVKNPPKTSVVVHKPVVQKNTSLMSVPRPSSKYPSTFLLNMDNGKNTPKIMMVIGDPELLAKFVSKLT